jgi:hypothetical protein
VIVAHLQIRFSNSLAPLVVVGLDPAIHPLRKRLLKIDGCPDPGYANRLRPKADFGGQEASPGLSSVGAPKL